MKAKYKPLIIMGLLWLAFTAFAFTTSTPYPLVLFSILLIIFSIIFFGLIDFFYTSRIKQLKQAIARIVADENLTKRIKLNGHDEFTTIANNINKLLDSIQTHQNKLHRKIDNKTKELKTSQSQLQKEINERITSNPKTSTEAHPQDQTDKLTGLPNRTFFNAVLHKTMSHAKRRDKIIAILLLDIDNFKKINEQFGLSVGDQILKEVAQRFTNTLRLEDILVKLEGDEFIILLNDIGKPKFASTVAEKLIKSCSTAINIDKHTINIALSIGISIYPNDGTTLEQLIGNADAALHQAKQLSGSQYQFYAAEMGAEAKEYIQLDSAFKNALQNNELTLYYQPKLNIKQGVIVGAEALMRWTHPKFGIISPSKLIPLAEESGLSMALGEWVIREACKTNKYWQNEGYTHLFVSVNLSPKQFQHPDIAKIIAKILEETQLNPSYLELEINENTVMNDIEFATKRLKEIKDTGVKLSIDHFGSGATSVSQLKKLPISTVKIDHSFIKGIPNNPDDIAIVNAFISLAHQLGLEVVAEGVETAEQVQYLGTQACDIVQGYFLSHPLPAQKIILQFQKLNGETSLT